MWWALHKHPARSNLRCKVVAPTKPPPQAGAAPSPAIEMAAASADALLAAIPGTPGAGAAPPPAIETAAALTDALLAAIPGTPGAGAAPLPAIETVLQNDSYGMQYARRK